MTNCETKEEIIATYQLLVSMKDKELLHLTTAKVEVQKIDEREPLQTALDHTIGSLSVVYLFSALEEQGFNLSNTALQNLDNSKIKKLKAWKHIRHSAGHGFDGKRVHGKSNSYDSEFEEVWEQDVNFKARVHFDQTSDKIRLESTAGLSCLEDLISIFEEMINA